LEKRSTAIGQKGKKVAFQREKKGKNLWSKNSADLYYQKGRESVSTISSGPGRRTLGLGGKREKSHPFFKGEKRGDTNCPLERERTTLSKGMAELSAPSFSRRGKKKNDFPSLGGDWSPPHSSEKKGGRALYLFLEERKGEIPLLIKAGGKCAAPEYARGGKEREGKPKSLTF